MSIPDQVYQKDKKNRCPNLMINISYKKKEEEKNLYELFQFFESEFLIMGSVFPFLSKQKRRKKIPILFNFSFFFRYSTRYER